MPYLSATQRKHRGKPKAAENAVEVRRIAVLDWRRCARREAPVPRLFRGAVMNQDAKKTALRMIPYGIYVLTADDREGNVAAATVNWVTQTAFAPPLIVIGVKADAASLRTVRDAQAFALNMLGKDQKPLAFTFFRPADVSEGKLSGQSFHTGTTGAPILNDVPAAVECRLKTIIAEGDHHIVVGEVVEAHVMKPPAGRPDAAILKMKDLGDNVFYGG